MSIPDEARMHRPQLQPILEFWLGAGPDKWFAKSDAFDAEVTRRLLDVHEAAAAGALDHWENDRDGALALVILFDQAPRNMFRGTPRAFATDARALAVAQVAIARGFDAGRDPLVRRWFHMPLMHAEDLALQERCVALCRAGGDETGVEFALIHRDVIARFGRFPHRNAVLGRPTTNAERVFLDEGGFSA